jgi:hypothetical protein
MFFDELLLAVEEEIEKIEKNKSMVALKKIQYIIDRIHQKALSPYGSSKPTDCRKPKFSWHFNINDAKEPNTPPQ